MFHLQADTRQVSLPSLLAHYMNGQKLCFLTITGINWSRFWQSKITERRKMTCFTYLLEEIHGTGVVHAWGEYHEEIINQHRPEIQVELQRLVVQLNVSHFTNDIFEKSLFPGHCWVSHHGLYCIVVFFVFLVQEHKL